MRRREEDRGIRADNGGRVLRIAMGTPVFPAAPAADRPGSGHAFLSSEATTPAAGVPRCSKVQIRRLGRAIDRRRRSFFGPGGVRALVIHERRSAQHLTRLDARNKEDVVSGLVYLDDLTGRVGERGTTEDRRA